jgi:hypothetical protein
MKQLAGRQPRRLGRWKCRLRARIPPRGGPRIARRVLEAAEEQRRQIGETSILQAGEWRQQIARVLETPALLKDAAEPDLRLEPVRRDRERLTQVHLSVFERLPPIARGRVHVPIGGAHLFRDAGQEQDLRVMRKQHASVLQVWIRVGDAAVRHLPGDHGDIPEAAEWRRDRREGPFVQGDRTEPFHL